VTVEDPDYFRNLDSVARFYNSQGTAHVGYLITSVVLYLTIFSIVQPTKALEEFLGYFRLEVHPLIASIVVVAVFLLFLPVWIWLPFSFSFRYQLARTQFYMELSSIVWEHMGISGTAKIEPLRKRATDEDMSIQGAVMDLLEARLYRYLWISRDEREPPKEDNGELWMHVFHVECLFWQVSEDYQELVKSDDYKSFLATYEKNRKVLGVWNYGDLLWTAHRGTVKRYEKIDQRYKLFERFLD
jgi:hypothetical protein